MAYTNTTLLNSQYSDTTPLWCGHMFQPGGWGWSIVLSTGSFPGVNKGINLWGVQLSTIWISLLLCRFFCFNFQQPIYGYGSLEDMLFRSTTTKDGDIFFVEDKEIGLRELAMNVAIPTDPGQRTVKGDVQYSENFFYSSRDIFYSVFYHFSCKPHNVITFLICIIHKRQW